MTEEDAKTRWCPFTRAQHNQAMPSGNRRSEETRSFRQNTNCIASACMAWRTRIIKGKLETRDPSEQSPGPGWTRGLGLTEGLWFKQSDDVLDGYCGLAGQP